MNENEEFLGLGWFIKEISDRAGFTRGDARLLYDAMVEVISEIIEQKKTLILTGFLKFEFVRIHRKNSWDGLNKKFIGPQDYDMLKITPSIILRRLYSITLKKQLEKQRLSDEEEFE